MRSIGILTAGLTLVASYTSGQGLILQHSKDHPGTDFAIDQVELDSFSDTIVSTLSQSANHTTLLHLLQRSKCIPLLAHIGNATLFAPTDQAWKAWEDDHRPSDPEVIYQGWLTPGGLDQWLLPEEEAMNLRIQQGGNAGDERKKLDNQNFWLRQHLLYHMLNYTLPPSALLEGIDANGTTLRKKQESEVSIETTLLFPMLEAPLLPPTPPPGPPWLPRGGEGLLGGHGQRLRIAKGKKDGRGMVGVDWLGAGGIGIWDGSGWVEAEGNSTALQKGKGGKGDDGKDKGGKDQLPKKEVVGARWARNGVVVGIDGVLEPPPSIQEIIHRSSELSYLSHLLPPKSPCPAPLPDDLGTASHLTIFAPSNEAFKGAFDEIERVYLEGGYGAEGVGRVVGGSVVIGVGKGQVGWSDVLRKNSSDVESASGLHLDVESNSSLAVNGTNATTIDIYASNGVIHILPSLLLPENFTLLNSAEKVLLSVNATRFVSLLRDANLSSKYVGEPGKEQDKAEAWTFLAPTDDVMDLMDRLGGHSPPIPKVWEHTHLDTRAIWEGASIGPQPGDPPFKDASPLASLLQYHILPGRYAPSDIKHGMLLGTELRTTALKGARQRLRVDVSDSLTDLENIGQGEIRFGGASVRGKLVRAGKSLIYLISSLLSPPDDVLQTAVSDLQLSTFIAAVYAADMERIVKHTPGLTWFLPRNRACNALGLGMQYLLSAEGKDELRKVLRYHAVDGIIYSDDVEVGKTVHKTLGGGEIILNRSEGKNGNFTLSSPTKWEGHDSGESFPANGELRPARISQLDALTDTGVIHIIDSLEMPADVSLTIAKLIRGSKQNTMLDLMTRGGLEWVLQGREPTHDEVSKAELHGVVRTWAQEHDSDDDAKSLAMPSYTVLCPSDKAFSRINITHYLSDRSALLDLLKLHIIPTQPATPTTSKTKQPAKPPKDGQPLSLADDLVYDTLYSSKSAYGQLAFRATGDNSFLVGIRNARGRRAEAGGEAARVGASGRATVRWRRNKTERSIKRWSKDKVGDDPNYHLWKGGLALGGGVLMIDNVLVPYEPSWFSRWGWLVITLSGIGVLVLVGGATAAWWWMSKGKDVKYEPLEGEEED